MTCFSGCELFEGVVQPNVHNYHGSMAIIRTRSHFVEASVCVCIVSLNMHQSAILFLKGVCKGGGLFGLYLTVDSVLTCSLCIWGKMKHMTLFFKVERTREGQGQSDQHWKCFTGIAGKTVLTIYMTDRWLESESSLHII